MSVKVTLICPIYNEVDSVEYLIKSMLSQSRKPDEIIFVDSFSKDGTAEIIKKYKFQGVRLIQKKSNISQARNIAIQNAKFGIIACTDASCKLDKNWLKNIILPIEQNKADVVSGGYIAISNGGIEDYISMITVKPMSEWKDDFLPSSRSIAFKKSAWQSVGGYDETLYTGEDTLFDIKLKEKGYRFKIARTAIVYWRGRDSIKKFTKQFYLYGKGDGESKNIFLLKNNFLFFIFLNLIIVAFFICFLINPIISFLIFILSLLFLILIGIKYSFKTKKIGCLVYIPLLYFIKRAAYYIGVWRGLFK